MTGRIPRNTQLMIEKLQHQLHGANRHRFGSKSEGMDQLQLFAENEEIAEAAVKAAETAPAEPIELKEKPRRKPLLLDRLTHHVNILEMNGDSYRLAQSRGRKGIAIN